MRPGRPTPKLRGMHATGISMFMSPRSALARLSNPTPWPVAGAAASAEDQPGSRQEVDAGDPTAVDVIDDPLQARALQHRWQAPPNGRGLLLIDPVGGPGGPMMASLSRSMGRPVQRSRLLSPLGLRPLATLEELTPALSHPGPMTVRCLRVRRLESLVGSQALVALLGSCRLVAVLSGALAPDTLGRWAVGAGALARQPLTEGQAPRWLLFAPVLPRPWPATLPQPGWMQNLQFVRAQPVGPSLLPGLLWNHVLAAWMADRAGPDASAASAHLGLRPAPATAL